MRIGLAARLGGLSAALLWALPVQADPELRWAVVDWAPSFILKHGQLPPAPDGLADGQFDVLLKEVASRMSHYQHHLELVNSVRLWRLMSLGEPVCAGPVRKSAERLSTVYFTPVVRFAPVGLVVRSAELATYPVVEGRVSLESVLANTSWRGGLEQSRSYGSSLDPLLKNVRKLPRENASRVGRTSELVASRRYDYTLEYAHVVEYLGRTGQVMQPLSSLPLKEAGDWEVGYMVCPRTPWGLSAITAMDKAIRQASAAPPLREAYLRWLPAELRQAQKAAMEAFYDARAQGGAQIE